VLGAPRAASTNAGGRPMSDRPVVMITGGAGGIGKALARRYLCEGACVALVDRDPAALERAVDAPATRADAVLALSCDITQPEAVRAAVQRVKDRFGRLDTLIHCAGLTQVSPLVNTDLDVYRRVMEVNFFGAVAVTQAALPLLLASRGQIIVLSSVAGFAPLTGRTGYCASKHALHGFFDAARAELRGRGVHVMVVCPSFVATDFARSGLAGNGSVLQFDRVTTGRPLNPDAVARAIVTAARRRKRLLVLSPTGKLAYWVSSLFPGVYERLMNRRFRVEIDRDAPQDR